MSPETFVEVAVPVPVAGTFRYLLPPDLAHAAGPGWRVRVPFRGRKLIGYTIEAVGPDAEEVSARIKPVLEVLDEEPLFGDEDLALYRWVSQYYLHPLGMVLKTALPSGARGDVVQARTQRVFYPGPSLGDAEAVAALRKRAKVRAQVLDLVVERGFLTAVQLKQALGSRGAPAVKALAEADFIEIRHEEFLRDGTADAALSQDGAREGPTPTDEQTHVLEQIHHWLSEGEFAPVLLQGVTGSGKTEVYLRAIHAALEADRGALVLVPEIALTPQLVERFYGRFGASIAVLHSALSHGERFDAWRRICRGEARIAIGARSAVFAPVENLGIVVVDEEHEGSYKQDDGLRYNARDVAVYRARQTNAVCVLASATPSLESRRNAADGRYNSLRLSQRIGGASLPPVEIVPFKRKQKAQTDYSLSGRLVNALDATLASGKQALLLLNRRGYAPFVICRDCGYTLACKDCAVSLTYHSPRGRAATEWLQITGLPATLRCHYCGRAHRPPQQCEVCEGTDLRLAGVGTQRLEKELAERFPEARVARMDRDTTSTKGAHARILKQLRDREIDILMGTQMIAKGLDFPNVTLVGVVFADAGLNVPDFRAAERTFQLLTQVAGRAGRGETPGRVLVQALNEEHYAVQLAAEHDFDGFWDHERVIRRELGYPPYARLVNVKVDGPNLQRVEEGAFKVSRFARSQSSQLTSGRVTVIGPAPAPLERVRKRWRWQVLLKGQSSADVRAVANAILSEFKNVRDPRTLRVEADVDPQSLL